MPKKINKKPSPDIIKELYILWLKGQSLRYLASYLSKTHGISVNHSSIASWFTQEYGEGATDPVACSLQRSLLEDFEDNAYVHEWVFSNLLQERSKVQHRSNHSMNQLTKYQTVTEDGILEYLCQPSDSAWSALNEEEVITEDMLGC